MFSSWMPICATSSFTSLAFFGTSSIQNWDLFWQAHVAQGSSQARHPLVIGINKAYCSANQSGRTAVATHIRSCDVALDSDISIAFLGLVQINFHISFLLAVADIIFHSASSVQHLRESTSMSSHPLQIRSRVIMFLRTTRLP